MNTSRVARQLNPEILTAYGLVVRVRSELEVLLPQAQASGSVTVSETQLRGWIQMLQRANEALGRVAVIQIFPPPPVATFVSNASTLIETAITILEDVPVAALLIFPPQPGQATLSLVTLQRVINTLQLAERNLLQALMA